MSVQRLQYGLGAVFLVLGGWCVLAPGSVIAVALRPAFQSGSPALAFAMACFGSQALISGLFAATSRFTRTTFLAYAIGLIPFFVFDGYFYAVRPVLTGLGAAADLAGNLVMLTVCALGWRLSPRG